MKVFFLRPDAVRREFELLDEVSSFEETINYLNSFDWKKGKKVTEQRTGLGLESFPQILRFQRTETDYVEFSPKAGEDFYVSCLSGKMIFETLVTRDIGRQKFSIEDFLQDFWADNLQEKYNFEEIDNSGDADVHFESKFGVKIFWPFLFLCIGPGIVAIQGQWSHKDIDFLLLISSIFGVFLLPYAFLLGQYFKYNKNTELSINIKGKSLTLTKAGQHQIFLFKDITKSKMLINENQKSYARGWGYLLLEIGDKERIVITNFLHKDLKSLSDMLQLNPVPFSSIFPFIRLGIKSDSQLLDEKNEFEVKAQEFTMKWSGKTKEELLKIKQNPSEYADYAIEAANRLLKK